jgi:YD repeat-containing protein
MKRVCLIIVVLAVGVGAARAGDTRLYGPDGRSVGTASTDSAGSTVVRDAQGRVTGRASTDSAGTTIFRDAQGRITGSASAPRR